MPNPKRKQFLLIVIIFTMISPLVIQPSSPEILMQEGILESPQNQSILSQSEGDFIWHYDCSNMTDFVEVVNNTWALNNNPLPQNVVNGTLESSGTYIHPTDFGTGTDFYGPLYYTELASPINIMNFREIRATMEIDSATGLEGGMICVILNDQNNVPIIGMTVVDGWSADLASLPDASWTYGNGSQTNIGLSSDSRIFGQYNETLRVWLNATGVYCELPQINEYKLIDIHMIDQCCLQNYCGNVNCYMTDHDRYRNC